MAAPAAASLGLGALPDAELTYNALTLLGASLLSLPAGAWLEAWPKRARACAALAVVAALVALYPVLARDPSVVVGAGALLVGLYLMVFLDPIDAPEARGAPPGPASSARGGLAIAASACFAVVVESQHALALAGAVTAVLAAFALTLRWASRRGTSLMSRAAVLATLALGVVLAGLAAPDPGVAGSLLGGALLIAFVLVRPAVRTGEPTVWDSIFDHPARVLVATFAALSALGALVLALPASSESGVSVGLMDAAFTAVSAVCVTGLIVLDTPNAFGAFGEGALLLLIQVGGLGIMAFYTVALSMLGRRLSLRHERAVVGAINVEERGRLARSVQRIFLVTAITELLGAAALFARMLARTDPCAAAGECVAGATCVAGACAESVGQTAWRALFTSISAFCNAGFALQTDSLVPYQDDPIILHVVALLIIVGGLSPIAVVAVPRWVRGRQVNAQVSLILWTSSALIVVGALGYGLMEWTVTLGHLDWPDRLHNAWFQSVTLRTAGFNTVDLAASRPATQAMMIVFMFIGGSPGGTAGGVKTTTAVVLILTVVATLRGHPEATAFGRRIGRRTVYKAAAVVTLGVLSVFGALIAIELTQAMDAEVAGFEVVSALATVGLSIGGTAALDDVGKPLVMLCMFAGRVGPLTLLLFLAERQPSRGAHRYPETEIDVG